jgi:pimeloyl-ACP methyl ester carboxylesterase
MAVDGGAQLLLDQTEIGLSRIDSRDRLSSLTSPSLVLAGTHDQLCTPEMQYEMAKRLPKATLAILPHAGHFVTLEQPSTVAASVATWLNAVLRAAKPGVSDERGSLHRTR